MRGVMIRDKSAEGQGGCVWLGGVESGEEWSRGLGSGRDRAMAFRRDVHSLRRVIGVCERPTGQVAPFT